MAVSASSFRVILSARFILLLVLPLTISLIWSPLASAQEPPKPTTNLAPSTPLTLAQAIAIAAQNQPSLSSASAQRQAARERILQAKTRFLPAVTVGTLYQKSFSDSLLGTDSIIGRNVTSNQQTAALSWRLLDNGQRSLNVKQAEQNELIASLGESNTLQSVIGSVSDAYYSVLRNEAIVRVNQAQVSRTKQLLDQVNGQIQAGTAAAKDYLQPESDYLNAQVNVLNAQVNADVAYAQLRNAMGTPSTPITSLADVSLTAGELPLTAKFTTGANDAETIQKIIALALQNRPDVEQARQSVASNQTSLDQAKLALKPTLSVDAALQAQTDSNNQLLKRNGDNRQVGVSVSYPLFDGGNLRSQARASEQTVFSSEAQQRTTEQQVAFDVEQAYRNLKQAQITLPATDKAQIAAQTNYERAQTAYKVGTGSLADVIIAQTTLTQAQLNAIQALYNYYSADARLARTLGQAERIGGVTTATGTPVAK